MSAALCATAQMQAPQVSVSQMPQVNSSKVAPLAKAAESRQLSPNSRLNFVKSDNGLALKQLVSPAKVNHSIAPRVKAKVASRSESTPFFESFEGWDGTDLTWLPEGWTLRSDGDSGLTASQTWGVTPEVMFGPQPVDGDYQMGISFGTLPQDEWLITPSVNVSEGQILSFYSYIDPLFLFALDNVDWETYEFIGDKQIAATLQVWACEEGGSWEMIDDMANPYLDFNFNELLEASSTVAYTQHTYNLSNYAGKDMQFAFRYVGIDGNTMFLDAVSIDYPSLEANYSMPVQTLYWGFDRSAGMSYMTISIAAFPAFEPLYWANNTNVDGASYLWSYLDPDTSEWTFSFDTDLEVTYHPDYASDFTTRNNLYYLPQLNAFADGAADGFYQAPYDYLQAGGRAEFEFTDGSRSIFGLLPFAPQVDDISALTVDYAAVGDTSVPLFGHNANSTTWWTDHMFQGEAGDGDSAEIVSILNFIYPNANMPMVVKSAWVNALGKINADAEFTLEFFALSDEFVPYDEPFASATCTADKVEANTGSVNDYLTIGFDFDVPVVLDATHTAYIVKLSGFNSDAVPYFLPLQSSRPNADGLCHGFVEASIVYGGDQPRSSFIPMANFAGQYGECYNAFCINLGAEFPWLIAPAEDATIDATGSVDITFDSYYPAEELTFDAPTGTYVSASEGRYGNTVVTLTHDNSEVVVDGDLTVSAPGLTSKVKVTQHTSGIDGIGAAAPASTVVERFNATGQRVAAGTTGVVIERLSDGTVRKSVVK